MTTRFATYPSLSGRVVVVTGGASGIGFEIANGFAEQRARVAILDRDHRALEAAAAILGSDHLAVLCDVANTPALRAAIDDVARTMGGVDVLVANAADDSRHDWRTLDAEAWNACLSLNLGHQFFAAQAAEPHLKARGGGAIICLGSISWLNGTTGMVAYTTAKAGVHGLVRTLARSWGPARIRVNALLPGWTMTERQKALWVDEAAERQIDAAQCLPGRVMPGDIARMALFLASDDAAMITQQSFVVDGGWI